MKYDSKNTGRALIIGVSGYFDANHFAPIPECENDAWNLHRRAIDKRKLAFEPVNVRVMRDSAPEPEAYLRPIESQIQWALEKLIEGATPDDTVLFYFSGHGCVKDGVAYFVANDTRWSSLGTPGKGILISHVTKLFNTCKAGRKLAFIDACHSGEDLSKAAGPPMDEKLQEAFQQLGGGCVVLSSCEKGQRSWASDGQSIFTKYLLEALDGEAKDPQGNVTVFTLSKYVGNMVADWAGKQHPPLSQKPTMFGRIHAEGFTLVKGPDSGPRPSAQHVPSPVRSFWPWFTVQLASLRLLRWAGWEVFRLTDRPGSAIPVIPIAIGSLGAGSKMITSATLDTGASITCIPMHLVEALGLTIIDVSKIKTLGGIDEVAVYRLEVRIGSSSIQTRAVAHNALSQPLLGMDVLQHFQIALDFPRKRIALRLKHS